MCNRRVPVDMCVKMSIPATRDHLPPGDTLAPNEPAVSPRGRYYCTAEQYWWHLMGDIKSGERQSRLYVCRAIWWNAIHRYPLLVIYILNGRWNFIDSVMASVAVWSLFGHDRTFSACLFVVNPLELSQMFVNMSESSAVWTRLRQKWDMLIFSA